MNTVQWMIDIFFSQFVPRREDRLAAGDRLSLDIGALKRQYARLRERQRQAHVILAAACARHAAGKALQHKYFE